MAMAERFERRLRGVHIKNFVFDKVRKSKNMVVASGNLDLKKLPIVMQAVNFNRAGMMECEGCVDNPMPAMIKHGQAVLATDK